MLTGSAGKAALLDRWSRTPAFAGVAVLRNGVAAGPVAGGCFCCAGRGDLIRALRDLLPRARRGEVTRVVIETAADADPAAIAEAMQADLATASVFRLARIVAFVDGAADCDDRQIATADAILLGADVPALVAARVRAVGARADLRSGDPDPALLFGDDPTVRLRR